MILCDTTFLIDVLCKKNKALSLLDQIKMENLFTTEITVMEIYFGLFSNKYLQDNVNLLHKRQDQIIGVLHHFIILQFNRSAAIKTAQITGKLSILGQKIDFRDGMIAGTGLSNGITKVITQNVTHFNRIDEIEVISY